MVENPENARRSDRVQTHVSLLKEAENGHLDAIECPVCHEDAIAAWFSSPAPGVFRTWFVCRECGFETQAQQANRPRFYSESRRRVDLEDRDKEVLRNTLFKMPESST